MIHYHGGPITPIDCAVSLWKARHAFVSFAYPGQLPLAAEICQSFALDNGAYTTWKTGEQFNFDGYCDWVETWCQHPGFDFCLIPDVIDGDENDNLKMLGRWQQRMHHLSKHGVPVWHLHEDLAHLQTLIHCNDRVAFGSSGMYAQPGSEKWWERMSEAMAVACDERGRPKTKFHGLRMLSPTIYSHIPFASADSTNVAQNVGIDKRWHGPYQPVSKAQRALVLADRIESHVAAARWSRDAYGTQQNLELIG